MPTITDVLRSEFVTVGDIADTIEDTFVAFSQVQSSVVRSVVGGAGYAVLSNATVAVVTEVGQIVRIDGAFQYSNTTIGQGCALILRHNGGNLLVPPDSTTHESSTSGARTHVSWFWYHEPPTPGIQTYDVIFATAAGTAYVGGSVIAAAVLRSY